METPHHDLVIIGAGHAGSELAVAARQAGWAGSIALIGDEPSLPYHRPPLSKAYLAGSVDAHDIALRPAAAYERAGVSRSAGIGIVAIERASKALVLADGSRMHYAKLALCTGGRARSLVCAGMDPAHPPSNLLYLRTMADADRIRTHLEPGRRLVVVGGGYVGLEVAASAVSLGASVTVLEAQPRVLARVAGPQLSAFYESVHRAHGVTLLTGTGVSGVSCQQGRIVAVRCSDGRELPADVVVAGIGMIPNVGLAVAAGIGTPQGIPVDEHARTADPDIHAAGDCTLYRHPSAPLDPATGQPRLTRIESVPNALEQARAAASDLCGKPRPYVAVPWFWSDQYELKLQMAGLSEGYDQCVLRGEPHERGFCAFYLRGNRLLAVDAVNRPADFMLARRALANPMPVSAKHLADESHSLKDQLLAPVGATTRAATATVAGVPG